MRILCLALTLSAMAFCADDPYAPLRLYQGKWKALTDGHKEGAKADELTDECGRVGRFFACQQTVNGTPGALLVFVPAEKPGHYYTNNVNQQGWAGGRGELEIAGPRWVYASQEQSDGKTMHHRTVNQFTGRDRIHFEIAESSDGEHWTRHPVGRRGAGEVGRRTR